MFKSIIAGIVFLLIGTGCFKVSSKDMFAKSSSMIKLLGVIAYAIGLIIFVALIMNLVLSIVLKIVLAVVVIGLIIAVIGGISRLK